MTWIWLLWACGGPTEPDDAPPKPAPSEAQAPAPSEREAPSAEPATVEPVAGAPHEAGAEEVQRFSVTVRPIPAELRAEMTGVSWREDCPVHLDDLRLITLSHWDFDGDVAEGRLIVAEHVTDEVVAAFEAAFEERFPIARMQPVYLYDGDDDRSMAADNTSAFNCRPVAGGARWSRHAFGTAIDVNPVENPYVRGERVDPSAGAAFLDREQVRPGMLVGDSALVRRLREAGWGWGGTWRSLKDYQHLSESGR